MDLKTCRNWSVSKVELSGCSSAPPPLSVEGTDTQFFHGLERRQRRAQRKNQIVGLRESKRKLINQKKQGMNFEFHEDPLKFNTEENGTVFNGGQNKARGEVPHMTVHVQTISGKTISSKVGRKQGNLRIKDEVETKTKIPAALQHSVSQSTVRKEDSKKAT